MIGLPDRGVSTSPLFAYHKPELLASRFTEYTWIKYIHL